MSKAQSDSTIRVVKTAQCPSNSGRSQLTYQLGRDTEGRLYVKIHGNSNKGYFNAEWVGVDRILTKLSEQQSSFSSLPLKALFEGKSINTPHFMVAILLAEGLLIRDIHNSRYFILGNVDGFMARVEALIGNKGVAMPMKTKSKSKPESTDESLLDVLMVAH